MAQEKFRVGITRDVLSPSGEPIYGRPALRILDDPSVEWEYLPEAVPELTPEHASRYDALCVFGSRVSRKTVSGPGRRLKLVARLKRYKESRGLEFVDLAREEWILSYLSRANRGPLTPEGLRELYATVLGLTKREVTRETERP